MSERERETEQWRSLEVSPSSVSEKRIAYADSVPVFRVVSKEVGYNCAHLERERNGGCYQRVGKYSGYQKDVCVTARTWLTDVGLPILSEPRGEKFGVSCIT